MAITSKLGEYDITDAAMYILLEAGTQLSTSDMKEEIKDLLEPTGVNNTPLVNRNDAVIDQIIRNVVSHRHESSNNIIYRGYVDYDDGYWSITDKGKKYLRNQMKGRFTRELN
jgi:hypothetical protein